MPQLELKPEKGFYEQKVIYDYGDSLLNFWTEKKNYLSLFIPGDVILRDSTSFLVIITPPFRYLLMAIFPKNM